MQDLLWCPRCHGQLASAEEHLQCASCGSSFPLIDGVPVLINEERSIFSIQDFVAHRRTFFDNRRVGWLRKRLREMIPNISRNIRGDRNFRKLTEVLLDRSATPRVLVVGRSRRMRACLKVFAAFTSFYLKYFDHYLINKAGVFDCASGYYLIGRR